MPTSSLSKKLAADANLILSAVAGKAALRVFLQEDIGIVTTQFNIDEVRKYLNVIADKYDLSIEVLELQLNLLPLKIYQRQHYSGSIPKASKKLSGIDEDDIELLALAMKLKVPVWSNDRDFRNAGVKVYTTARLLKALKL